MTFHSVYIANDSGRSQLMLTFDVTVLRKLSRKPNATEALPRRGRCGPTSGAAPHHQPQPSPQDAQFEAPPKPGQRETLTTTKTSSVNP